MKKLLWACGLGLSLLALPGKANAFVVGNYEVDSGAKVWCNVRQFNVFCPTAGPWYLYWPYEAYFNAPPPGVNPSYVRPMSLPPGYAPPGAPLMQPAQANQATMPPAANGYRPPMPSPGPAYQPPAPGQGYQPPMPSPGPGYQPQAQFVGQGYQAPPPYATPGYQPQLPFASQGYQGYQPQMPSGPPHPQIINYFNK